MELLFNRVAMCGGGTSYEVYIPYASHPFADRLGGCTHMEFGKNKSAKWIRFCEFFIGEAHLSMPKGYDRYDDYKKLEARAIELEDRLLREVFPELKSKKDSNLSFLWHSDIHQESAKFMKEVDVPPIAIAE
jgi:hypothetical protein